MKKILLVNGPPSSGKDTVGKICKELVPDCRTVKMSRPLKCGAAALFYALHGDLEGEVHSACVEDDYYEDQKDEPLPRFFGKTPRDVWKSLSEDWIKPQFGKDFFGNLLTARIDKMPEEFIVVTDAGFVEEVEPLIERFGAENIALVRLSRKGCDFGQDSRGYIQLNKVSCSWDIPNTLEKSDLRWHIHGILSSIKWPCTSL